MQCESGSRHLNPGPLPLVQGEEKGVPPRTKAPLQAGGLCVIRTGPGSGASRPRSPGQAAGLPFRCPRLGHGPRTPASASQRVSLGRIFTGGRPGGSVVKNPPANAGETGDAGSVPEDPLKEEMATHSSVLAWRIPWTEKPGGLQSMGSQRVRLSDRSHTRRHMERCFTALTIQDTPRKVSVRYQTGQK